MPVRFARVHTPKLHLKGGEGGRGGARGEGGRGGGEGEQAGGILVLLSHKQPRTAGGETSPLDSGAHSWDHTERDPPPPPPTMVTLRGGGQWGGD